MDLDKLRFGAKKNAPTKDAFDVGDDLSSQAAAR